MSEFIRKPGALFWVMGILFLIWNSVGGCGIYLMDKFMSDTALLEAYGENGQAMLDARHAYSAWATAGYAIAVWGGLLASILYLIRKKMAVMVFVISLVGALIGFIPTFTNATVKASGGDSYWVMPVIVVLLGLFEIWWSRKKSAQGYLR